MARTKKETLMEIDDDLKDVPIDSARMEMAERAKKRGRPKKESPSVDEEIDEIEMLRKKLADAEAKKFKEEFILTAPARLKECETGIAENRNYLIQMNNSIKSLTENLSLLTQKK